MRRGRKTARSVARCLVSYGASYACGSRVWAASPDVACSRAHSNRRAWLPDRPAAAHRGREPGAARDPLTHRADENVRHERSRAWPPGSIDTGSMNNETPQRLLALERANHVRSARATLKRRLRAGEVAAAEAILRGSRDTDTMTTLILPRSLRAYLSQRERRRDPHGH
jgi:hypothetical protein